MLELGALSSCSFEGRSSNLRNERMHELPNVEKTEMVLLDARVNLTCSGILLVFGEIDMRTCILVILPFASESMV